jgi:hypothetical protein
MTGVLSVERKFFAPPGEFSSPSRETTVDECAFLVRRAAEPAELGERTGTQIGRAALRLAMTPNQVKKLWYRERRAIEHHEFLRIHAAVSRLEERRAQRRELRAEIDDQIGNVDQRDAGPLVAMARAPRLDEG